MFYNTEIGKAFLNMTSKCETPGLRHSADNIFKISNTQKAKTNQK